MRLLIAIVIAALLAFFFWTQYQTKSSSVTPTENVSSGIIRYGEDTLDALHANGLVTLNGTIIQGKLEVNGSLKGIKMQAGSLYCNGHAGLQQSTIRGKAEINGFFNATKSTFQGPLEVAAQKAEFQECTLQSLKMQNAGWVIGSQTVRLKGTSVVKGDITFESGVGKVYTSPNSRIEGKVIGGSVEALEPITLK